MNAFTPVRPEAAWTVGKHALMNVHASVRRGKTVLEPKSWRIPFQWQPAHYQDHDDQPFLLLLNSSGGFVEGDVSHFHAHLDAGSRALFTTANSSKFYKCLNGHESRETVDIIVEPEALVEFLPDEAIPFENSRVKRDTHIHLAKSPRMFATDMISAGRVHFGHREIFEFTSLLSEFVVTVDGQPLGVDRVRAPTPDDVMALQDLWGGARHLATVFIYSPELDVEHEEAVHAELSALSDVNAGVSRLGQLLAVRILAAETWQCHEAIFAAWRAVRPMLANKAAREIRKC